MIKHIASLTLAMLLYGCSYTEGVNSLNQIDQKAKQSVHELSPQSNQSLKRSFVRVINPKDTLLEKNIDVLKSATMSLEQLIRLVLPEVYIVTDDAEVKLDTVIDVDVKNISVSEFLNYLSSKTGYRIDLENQKRVNIASATYKRWNVAALVELPNATSSVGGNAKAGSAGGSSSLSFSKSDNTWESLLTGLKSIIGASGVVVDNKRLGEIYALGDPQKLKKADKWMQRMITRSQKQVLLDVAILEVTLNDGSANGIDWKAVQSSDNPLTLQRVGTQALSGAGAWNIIASGAVGAFQLDATVNFLRQYGTVNIEHNPSLTVTNGSTAYLGSAEQFSYVASITNETTTTNGVANTISTPEIKTIDVGINLSVTARLLENDEILIEVVPVISTLQEVETLFTDQNGSVVKAPKIALQELSTQVITQSGQPIHLAGMVTKKITESASNVPGALGQLFNAFFKSNKKEFEKKEVLIVITPTEV